MGRIWWYNKNIVCKLSVGFAGRILRLHGGQNMYCTKKITDDLIYVGGSDRRLALFENVYPVPRGVSYNSYLCLDEKTVLLDTVDHSISDLFFENVEHALNGRPLDYLIINHMEPDHCREIPGIIARWRFASGLFTQNAVAAITPHWRRDEKR